MTPRMPMLQKKSKYAIRALLALAQRPEQEPVLIADLAAQERIPKKFLEFISAGAQKQGHPAEQTGQRRLFPRAPT